MARIPDDELERLKRDVSVQRLAEARGVDLKTHGKDLIGLCPFHDDREPSLVVSPKKNLWHCLGACQAGGTAIDWVMKAEGVSFRHAVEILRQGFSGESQSSAAAVKRTSVRKLAPVLETYAEDQILLEQVVGYYQETLKQSPEALAYLERRGIGGGGAMDQFRIGYSNRTLGYRIPEKNRREGAEMRGRLTELGIMRGTGHEHLRGCISFPIFDEEQRLVEIYGRRIERSSTAPAHMYLPGPHRGVWNIAALQATKEIILCESIIDALTFWCAGFRNVTASYGINGFTDDHRTAFKRYSTERVLIAYDRDDAGEKAATSLAQELLAMGIDCYRIQFPKGMDANEYALKLMPAEKSLALVIRKALWMGKGQSPASVESAAYSPPSIVSPATSEPAMAEPLSSLDAEPPAPEPPPLPSAEASMVVPSPVVTPAAPPRFEPPAASPQPVPTPIEVPTEVKPEEIIIKLGDRRYRIRGLGKCLSTEQLRVNVLVGCGERFFVDTVDLYSARQRALFVKQGAVDTKVNEDLLKQDLGKVLLQLEAVRDQRIKEALEPKEKPVVLTPEEEAEALALLKNPQLVDRILGDFERAGLVGEETNKLVGYLACVSRKLEEPLAVVIQSSSAAGKSSLMEALLSFLPKEEHIKYSAMTGQSLYYMEPGALKHRVLAIVEEEGAQRASYALKLLQSEGELTIAAAGKDPTTGRLVTQEYRVEGPVMILLTTTAIDIDEELLNRCLVLTVNEDREQTRAIQRLQRERQTLEGLLMREDKRRLVKLHQNAQRLLKPMTVVNPFAERLTFLDDKTRTRRDHGKYLSLIRTITLLHQYQRPTKTVMHNGQALTYLEVTVSDIALANRLAHEVLGRSLDELPPHTRRLLAMLDQVVTEDCRKLSMARSDYRFTRRQIRERTGLSYAQIRAHLDRLVELEYVIVHRANRGQSLVYELLYEGQGNDGRPFLMGLLDIEALEASTSTTTNPTLRGSTRGVEAPLTPHCPPIEGPVRTPLNGHSAKQSAPLLRLVSEKAGNAQGGQAAKSAVVVTPQGR